MSPRIRMNRCFAPLAPSSPRRSRRGLTLVEMLVAMTVSLIMIYGMVTAFARIGEEVSQGRAGIEMENQMRSVLNRLQRDLEGVTVPLRPWAASGAGDGYFEYTEGPLTDMTTTILGDWDDPLMFTTRNEVEPFVGRLPNAGLTVTTSVQSTVAEVVWTVLGTDLDVAYGDPLLAASVQPQELMLYRRAFCVRPDIGVIATFSGTLSSDLPDLKRWLERFYVLCDVSVHPRWQVDASGNLIVEMVANSLEDLSRRECRFAHHGLVRTDSMGNVVFDPTGGSFFPGTDYPFHIEVGTNVTPSIYQVAFGDVRVGAGGVAVPVPTSKWVMMSHAIAFDVRAYDPAAPVRVDSPDLTTTTPTYTASPGDPGFDVRVTTGNTSLNPGTTIASGAYVDLGYNANYAYRADPPSNAILFSYFSGPPAFKDYNGDGLRNAATEPYRGVFLPTYDTWTGYYEQNGVNEDGDAFTDEGTDGLDNPVDANGNHVLAGAGVNGVDDPGERETAPPYALPLRGLQITLRMYESNTRQVRQRALTHDFIPE